MMDRVLIAGGGSGGHLFPGIAVVEELRRRLPRIDVLFVGTERGIEARVLPKLGERLHAIDAKPLVGRSPLELARNLAELPRAGLKALQVVHSFKPQLALGLGGYASGPMMLAAATLRVPSALLEQNVQPGVANRMLKHAVGRAYLAFEETAADFGPERARVFGNPIRRAFVDAARMAGHDPQGTAARSRSVLVLGGSQGAKSLNQLVPEALAKAGVRELGVSVVHQTGAAMVDEVQRRYRELSIEAEVVAFIDDVARAYVDASLVIARSGAGILAELCAIGRAAILIPIQLAGRHQADNALAMQRAGAALALDDPQLSSATLARHVQTLLTDSDRRNAMADAARRRGRPEAAAAIVDDLFAWLGVPSAAPPVPEQEPPLDPETPKDGAELASRPSSAPIRRRPRVKRAELRIRALSESADAQLAAPPAPPAAFS
jgi:UDP-N-acetylglucosamine--N-acetylmuramyl-(pentapeptide) pyrophosphoryl-undecaprenol N-acetylglucosamine transferase